MIEVISDQIGHENQQILNHNDYIYSSILYIYIYENKFKDYGTHEYNDIILLLYVSCN